MTRQEILTENQNQEMFESYMETNFFPGWDEVFTLEEQEWYYDNFSNSGFEAF